jgi:hypothetical protein
MIFLVKFFKYIIPFLFLTSTMGNKITLSQTTINPFQEGKNYQITAQLSQPIICPSNMPNCYLAVKYKNPNPELININPCYFMWRADEWHLPKTITLSSVSSFRNMKDIVYTMSNPEVDTHAEYYMYSTLPDINLHFKGIATGKCRGTGDPHYTTFDNYYYHYYGRGKEWLIRSKTLNSNGQPILQVQTITHGSGYSRNCALAMLEDGNFVMISVCSGSVQIYNKYLNTRTTSHPRILRNGGNGYNIEFPETGTTGTITFWGRNANVYVTLGGKYHNDIEGMCGNWDGVSSNEGNPAYRINEWSHLPSRWRVYPGSDEDLFSINNNKIRRSIDDTINYGQSNLADCKFTPPVYIRPILNQPNIEDITDLLKDLAPTVQGDNEDIVFDLSDFEPVNYVVPPEDLDTVIADLESQCDKFRHNEVIWDCIYKGIVNIDNVIAECKDDAQLTASQDVINQNWENVVSDCKTKLIIETKDDSEVISIIDKFCSITCDINQKCIDNNCVCINTNMKGTYCQYHKESIPEIIDINPKTINLYENNFKYDFVIQTKNISFDDNVSCFIRYSKYDFLISPIKIAEDYYTCNLNNLSNIIQTVIKSDNVIEIEIGMVVNYIAGNISRNLYSNFMKQKYFYSRCLDCQRNSYNCSLNNEYCYIMEYNNFINTKNDYYNNITCYLNNSRFDFLNPCKICIDNNLYIDYTYADCYPVLNSEYKYISDIFMENGLSSNKYTFNLNNILYDKYGNINNDNYFDLNHIEIVMDEYNYTDNIKDILFNEGYIRYELDKNNNNIYLSSVIHFNNIITSNYNDNFNLYVFYKDNILNQTFFIDSINIFYTIYDDYMNNPTTSTTTTTESTTTTTTMTTTTTTTMTTTTESTTTTTTMTTTTESTTESTTTTTTTTTTTKESTTDITKQTTTFTYPTNLSNNTKNNSIINNKQSSIMDSKNNISLVTTIIITLFSIGGFLIILIVLLLKYNKQKKVFDSFDNNSVLLNNGYTDDSNYNGTFTVKKENGCISSNSLYRYNSTLEVIEESISNPMYMEFNKYLICQNNDKKDENFNNFTLLNNNFDSIDNPIYFGNQNDLIEYYRLTANPRPLNYNLYDYKNNDQFNNIKQEVLNQENIYSYNNNNIKGTRIGPIINETYDTPFKSDNYSEI